MTTIDFSKLRGISDFGGTLSAPQGLADFYESFVRTIEALEGERVSPQRDVSQFVEGFRNYGVVGLLKEDINITRVSPSDFLQMVRDVGAHLGFNLGTVVVANLVGDRYSVLSASICRDKVERCEYLSQPLTIAQVRMKSSTDVDCPGFSVCNLALYDPQRAAEDAIRGFEYLQRVAPAVREATFARRLLARVRTHNIAPSQYAELCGVSRMRMEEVQHAKDHIFCVSVLKQDALPDEHVKKLLRDDSALLEHLHKTGMLKANSALVAAVIEYSGSLGGILMEMESLIRRGEHQLAGLVFDDFLWDKELRNNRELSDAHRLESQIFVSRLSHLIGPRNVTPAGLSELLHSKSVEEYARNAQMMLNALYRLDFYDDGERAERVQQMRAGA